MGLRRALHGATRPLYRCSGRLPLPLTLPYHPYPYPYTYPTTPIPTPPYTCMSQALATLLLIGGCGATGYVESTSHLGSGSGLGLGLG